MSPSATPLSWLWSTWRPAKCTATSWSASVRGASRSRATRRRCSWPTASATTSRSSTSRAARRSSRSRSGGFRGAWWSMTRGGGWRHAATGLMALWLAAAPARSQDAPPRQTLTIGYVEIAGDARYEPVKASDRIILKTRDHPFAAAEVALDEARALRRVLAVDFALARISVPSADRIASATLQALDERNIHFFVVDAPAEAFGPLAAALRGRDVLLFNATAEEDSLRRDLCAPEIVHTFPSLAMK